MGIEFCWLLPIGCFTLLGFCPEFGCLLGFVILFGGFLLWVLCCLDVGILCVFGLRIN